MHCAKIDLSSIQSTNGRIDDTQAARVDKATQFKLELLNISIFAQLTICACFLMPIRSFEKKDLILDPDILENVSTILMHLIGLSDQLESIFFENIAPVENRHFMHEQVKVFRDFMLDMETGTYYESCSLLNLLLLVIR